VLRLTGGVDLAKASGLTSLSTPTIVQQQRRQQQQHANHLLKFAARRIAARKCGAIGVLCKCTAATPHGTAWLLHLCVNQGRERERRGEKRRERYMKRLVAIEAIALLRAGNVVIADHGFHEHRARRASSLLTTTRHVNPQQQQQQQQQQQHNKPRTGLTTIARLRDF
jgi:hypothetical protein